MLKYMKKMRILLFVGVLILSLSRSVFGMGEYQIKELGEVEIPSDFNFSVGSCSIEHLFYTQATANENGYFAVCMPHLDQRNLSEDTFKKQYIDIYYPDGSFWKEISFSTQFDYTIELTADFINIYFYSYYVQCGLFDDVISCYAIADGAAMESGLREFLRQEQFTQGKWTYRCQKTALDYTRLVRSDGITEEIIINMPGQGLRFYFPITISVLAAGISLVLICVIRKRKTEDGSLS